jgi:hypothetical protein
MDFSFRELAGVVSSSSALLFSTQINGPPIQQLNSNDFRALNFSFFVALNPLVVAHVSTVRMFNYPMKLLDLADAVNVDV